MSKPLNLFIRPPFTDWTLIFTYGVEVPQPPTGPVINDHLQLQTTGNGAVFAACDGKLSVRPPRGGVLDPGDLVDIPAPGDPLPSTSTLFLHLSPLVAQGTTFSDRATQAGNITGFAYINVDPTSLEAALAELLDTAVIPVGALPSSQVVDLLLRGLLDVPVTAGHALGNASSQNAPAGARQIGFAALTNSGPGDPSYIYDLMSDFVGDDPSNLDDFLTLAPKNWPAIPATATIDDIIELTQTTLYPMPVLQDARISRNMSAAQWRLIGDNQKSMIRDRLLSRVGQAPPGSTYSPFEFDDLDWQNLFQLEAIVELYMNFNDPWRPDPPVEGANKPRGRFLTDGTPNPDYITADFLNPAGVAATVAGNVVTLDGNPDLSRVRINYDYLFLSNDTSAARPSHLYLITATNVGPTTSTTIVTLQAGDAPTLAGGSSSWEIRLRPHIVVIDSFGGRYRLHGNNSTVSSTDPSVVVLDGTPDISRVNPFFDTIYLPSDTARGSRTYRIIAIDNTNHTVTLDANPVLENQASRWHIPAGLSGELPPFPTTILLGAAATGFDHYDGMCFVIYNGQVRSKFRWSSYSAHFLPPGVPGNTSSMRGNRKCDFRSFYSENNFKNYDFKIEDPGQNDHVLKGRYYFDQVAGGVNDNPNGKTLVRLHDGNKQSNWSGSSGCVVSPYVYQMRDQLIEIYQAEYSALHNGNIDLEINKLYHQDRGHSQAIWDNTQQTPHPNPFLLATNWNDKIFGTFWLIRPDERPLNHYNDLTINY